MEEHNNSEEKFYPGMGIAYIPMHAEGDINHPDVEFGFVTSVRDDMGVFCRFIYNPKKVNLKNWMRTKSCSELCDPEDLQPSNHLSDEDIAELWYLFVRNLQAPIHLWKYMEGKGI